MRKVGIREARQQFSALLAEVAKGREVVITDRGKPVARMVPLAAGAPGGVPDLAAFRKTMPRLEPPVSEDISRLREDRL